MHVTVANMECILFQNSMEKTEITESVTVSKSGQCTSSLNYSPEPLLNFTANLIEVLRFG